MVTKKKVVKKKKKKEKKATLKRAVGRIYGLSVHSTWAKLFEDNERLPRKKKLTDAQIAGTMKKEFPNNVNNLYNEKGVKAARYRYNLDGLHKGGEPPATRSKQYDQDGNEVIGRASRKPKKVKKEKKKVKKTKPKLMKSVEEQVSADEMIA